MNFENRIIKETNQFYFVGKNQWKENKKGEFEKVKNQNIKPNHPHLLQRIWAIGLMEVGFVFCDDLLRLFGNAQMLLLFAIPRVERIPGRAPTK